MSRWLVAGRSSNAADDRDRVPGKARRRSYPEAKRVLLTAYGADAAIQAINDIKLHHYLLKPWAPPVV